VWSSTYLAIRIAVREGSGFPPFTLSSLRVLAAGLILLTLGLIFRARFRLSREQFVLLAVTGVLLWVGGNGLVTWAEQHAHSGYAALLVGSMPIWIAVMEATLDRKLPSWQLVVGLAIGFTGLAVLTAPVLATAGPADAAAVVALLAAPLCWGAGSLILKRRHVGLSPLTTAGYQHLIGGVALFVVAFVRAEPTPEPTFEAWVAWGYLVVFGSVVAFTAYLQALRQLPMSLVSTYTYVNPVGAVILGVLVLDEPVTALTVVGAALVLLGVAAVFRAQMRSVPLVVATSTPVPSTPAARHE
jgi:drug/metabolite transporter (DMT)-like permease